MPRFAANLSFMFMDLPFLDRFDAAAKAGFKGVEFMFPYDFAAADIQQRLADNGLELVLFNGPPGNTQANERGLASLPGREAEFKASIALALEYAAVLGNKRLHVMAGLMPAGADRARHREVYVKNIAYAAGQAKALGLTVVIEPINTRDIPGFFINRQDEAHAVCRETGADNAKVQMDFYHCQIVEGDLTRTYETFQAGIGHTQIAGVPDRHEPDLGEVNYPAIFELLDRTGYAGWVGCEYRPKAGTSEGLGWLKPYL